MTTISGTTTTESSASRVFRLSRAAKLTANSKTMRPAPMAWSAKKRRSASTSEVVRWISSPVFAWS